MPINIKKFNFKIDDRLFIKWFFVNIKNFILRWKFQRWYDSTNDTSHLSIIVLKIIATWECLCEFFTCENISFKNFSNDSIWPLGCLYKTSGFFCVFEKNFSWNWFYIIRIYARKIPYFKPYRLVGMEWDSSTFSAFSFDEYLYSLVFHIMIC